MKKLSLILVLAMLFAAAPTSLAENSDYENLILTVKNRIEVPAKYDKFDNLNQYEDKGELFYSFMWSTENGEQIIRVTCDSDGDVYNYSKRQESEEYAYLTMDSEAAKEAALSFIEKTNPDLKGKLVLELASGYLYGGLDFTVTGVFNGISYYRSIGSVSVAEDMTVTSMHISAPDIAQETVNCISEEEAYKLYMDKIGVQTEYYTYTDKASYSVPNDTALVSFPAYSDFDFKAIDALTGEVIILDKYAAYTNYAAGGVAMEQAVSDSNYKELSPSEKENIVELNNLITRDEALKIIKERTGIDFVPTRSNLRNNGNKSYYYSFGNDTGNFSVNANNGDILSMHLYFEKAEEDKSALANYNPADEQSVKQLVSLLAPVDGGSYELEESGEADAQLVYKVNGIKLNSPGAYFSKGENSYSFSITALSEYKNIEYDQTDKFIPISEQFSDTSFVKLRYVDTPDGIKAAYFPDSFLVNAISGKNVNSRNEERSADTAITYSDIENHWVRNAAEHLAYGGIGFYEGVLNPDKAVTSAEAYALLDRLYYSGKEELADSEKTLTRADAASIIVKALELTALSESDIFKQPYSDVTENIGAVAILKGYGIIAGDTDTFRPNDNITRAEFLQMLYNTLLSQ